MGSTQTISFRAPPAIRRRLHELQGAGSRSHAIVRAVMEASDLEDLPPIPSEQELLKLLGESARGGNVSAMRELLAYHHDHRPHDDPLAEFDELARRAAR